VPKVVVVYDISDDKIRFRVARYLQAKGLSRIQRSAFVGSLQGGRIKDLVRGLSRLIDPDTDVVHIFSIQPVEWERKIVLGTPRWGERSAVARVL